MIEVNNNGADITDTQAEDVAMTDMAQYEESFKPVRIGDVLQGKVVKIDNDGIMVDANYKTDGFIPLNEISDSNSGIPSDLKVGDYINAVVIQIKGKEGELVLSKKRADREINWKRIIEAFDSGDIVTATCTEAVKGGIIVDIGVRGFVPASQVDVKPVRDLTELLGEEMRLKIIELDPVKKKVVLSRRQVLEAEKEIARKNIFSKIKEGDIIEGTVERITNFGVFVNLGGVDGLVHISELSWKRVGNPADVVKIGEKVDVLVLKMDMERNRISLSLRQAKPDPWLLAEETFPVGTKTEGTVTKLAKNYAFIEVTDGIEGLIPIQEISNERIDKPEDVLSLDQKVMVTVLEVKSKDRRMLLSMREPKVKAPEEYEKFTEEKTASTIGDILKSKMEGKSLGDLVKES